MQVEFIDDSIDKFLDNLDTPTRAKVVRTIGMLEAFGNLIGMPHSKSLHYPLFELSVTGKILYVFHNRRAWILHIFVKKIQKTPKPEIARALANLDKLV